jgi:hypothetical protein
MRGWLLALAIAGASVTSAMAQDFDWRVYVNPRFGYAVDLPLGFLQPRPAPENGDGLTFVSRDGGALVAVWGGNNALGWTLDQYFQSALARPDIGKVTYQRKAGDWYVLSGYRTAPGGEGTYEAIFYERVEMAVDGGAISGVLVLNAPSLKEMMSPVIDRISKSLTPPARGG